MFVVVVCTGEWTFACEEDEEVQEEEREEKDDIEEDECMGEDGHECEPAGRREEAAVV